MLLATGDIANSDGDIQFSGTCTIAAGEVAVTIPQAIKALRYGWSWIGTHDEMIVLARGPCVGWAMGLRAKITEFG